MSTAQATPAKTETARNDFTETLEAEAGELEALNVGLRRHLSAWRDANESAILRLGAVMARIDSILERAERTRS